MSYVIFGRAIKNEHIVLGVIGTVFGGTFLATRGGKKDVPVSGSPSIIEKVKEAVPINASSSEEEQFIRKYIAEAEKEGGSGH